nr:hypothetical protein [Streptomyces sp. DSM 40971]
MALAEIELCGELMIAASAAEAAGEERLSLARIDEVLGTAPGEGDEGAWQPLPRQVSRCSASSRAAQAPRPTQPSGQRS